MNLQIFGHQWRRAAKDHTCWLCGGRISRGEGYFISTGTVDGKMFSVKHCRSKCECAAETLEQNPHLWPAVFSPTLNDWGQR
ncbi:hypothetical protein IQ03_02446 [Gemmobacter caeni]|uniref:Uncharacterized protein n=1 Tax=Gemmobacter caeni TaxID=589035 RepID=A0A2T6AZ49_9RHOB|nr:hypothetical protein C8N34_108189 [Gemmobacter caeni]TWI98920.1 hypothetical protein IQ03_02446 [Gemmobacter caeni]